jgi:integrase
VTSATPAPRFYWAAASIRRIVQELLGHATIAMTLDTYSHYLPSMGNQAKLVMADALG